MPVITLATITVIYFIFIKLKLAAFKKEYFKIILFYIILEYYPGIVKLILDTMNCEEISGIYYMTADT